MFAYAKYGPNYQQLVVNPINQVHAMHGGGEFSWYEDTTQNLHMISLATINNAILPLLGVDPGVPHGSVGSSYRVGGRDVDGAVIISISEPKPAAKPPAQMKDDLTFRTSSTFGL